MKKIMIFMALSLVLVTLLSVACGGSDKTTNPVTTPTTNTPPNTMIPVTPATEPPSVAELTAGGYSHPEMPRITSYQLKEMLEGGWVIGDDFALVDTQGSTRGYHIWGCTTYLSITYSSGAPILSNMILWQLRNLPKDKLIIFYDHANNDGSAVSAAQVLIDLNEGYDPENIKVLWQGFNRWRELRNLVGPGYTYYDPTKAGSS